MLKAIFEFHPVKCCRIQSEEGVCVLPPLRKGATGSAVISVSTKADDCGFVCEQKSK